MRNNNKGISYVELVIVMGILAALVGISSISFSAAWRARASKAANSVDALLAQSKVYALSGDDNCLQVMYHSKDSAKGYTESGYYAELLKVEKDPSDGIDKLSSSAPYKSELIGNDRLEIRFGTELIRTDAVNGAIRIVFNGKTGAVKGAALVTNAASTSLPASADDTIKMYFHFGNTYCVSLWKITGEHGIT
jgi:Tfp pilus assembly protein FimT